MSETPKGYTRGMGFIAPIAFTLANMVINVAASTLPAWAAATSYASGVQVIDGASRIIYRSLKDNNVGNAPALSGTTSAGAWQAIGVEERLRMFDASLGSYTERADMIEVHLKPGRVITDIALFGVRATSVQVVMIDANEGQVFDSGDVSMLRPSGNSHWGYFFNPIERDERLLISGLPAYTQATTIVRIKAPGAIARCGEIVAGRAVWLGNTYWRPSIGFDEFGEKKRDAWGGWMIEGYNIADLFGVTFTVTFIVRSAKAGVHCLALFNASSDRSFVAEPARSRSRIEWDFRPTVRRDSPLVAQLGGALGLDVSALDELFIHAATL